MLKKMRNGAIAAMGGTLIASSLLLAPSASAQDLAPQGVDVTCTTSKSADGGTGYAKCHGLGWGDHARVRVTCIGDRGQKWVLYGPWKGNDQTSGVRCEGAPNRAGVTSVGTQFDY
ncbi:hypothetical protein [Streptomyces beijiangensis]|uniref:Secreted protein n=1 Tax=Streptomyces beijiangensis TaxID=163361 RepID=A0A939F4K4_9ACTN|nr:hypothetical protein [Streptomyces beijiangensis]MBO0511334.1 hypothetical protein [Streptomyces beijiangensis]